MSRHKMSDVLFLYLLGSFILLWGVFSQAPNLVNSNAIHILAIFAIGALGIVLYIWTYDTPELTRWCLILIGCGVLILLFDIIPMQMSAYIIALRRDPYLVIGATSTFLGFLLFLVPVLKIIFEFSVKKLRNRKEGDIHG